MLNYTIDGCEGVRCDISIKEESAVTEVELVGRSAEYGHGSEI